MPGMQSRRHLDGTNQLRRLDTTLLMVFAELMRSRKLGVVAEKLGLTRSAISHSVSRLRDIFGDPLFVRIPTGVVPTQRALELSEPVARALSALQDVLEPVDFDPRRLVRTFRISANDYLLAILAPHLIDRVHHDAPKARLCLVTVGHQDAISQLTEGRLDFAFGWFPENCKRYMRRVVKQTRMAVVARKNHPLLRRGLTFRLYLKLNHVVVSGSGELTGPMDEYLSKMGQERRVVDAVPQYFAALVALADSDAIATVPYGVAEHYAPLFPFDVYDVPIQLPEIEFAIVCGLRAEFDPALKWIMGLLPRDS